VRVPQKQNLGVVKVRLSFKAWKKEKVRPAVVELKLVRP